MKKVFLLLLSSISVFLFLFSTPVLADNDVIAAIQYENGVETYIYSKDIKYSGKNSTTPFIPSHRLAFDEKNFVQGGDNSKGIVGPNDDRTFLSSTQYTQAPYSMICEIEVTFGNNTYYGTGFLVGPRTIMTACHVVYDSNLSSWYDSIAIYFHGNYNNAFTYIMSRVRGNYSSTLKNTGQDWALLDLGVDVGYNLGWLGLITNAQQNDSIRVAGYPVDYPNQMLYGNGIVAWVNPDNNILSHKADTSAGESGSPVLVSPYYWYACGIHCRLGDSIFLDQNYACNINSTILSYVEERLDEGDE